MKIGKRSLRLLLCLVLLAGLLPVTAFAAEIEITSANVTITKPVGGVMPDLSAVSSDTQKYYADVDSWGWMAYGTVTPASGIEFKTHERYELRIIFRAKLGYTFAEDCEFTINGAPTGCYSKDGNEFRYTYLYAADPNCPTYTVTFHKDDGSNTTKFVTGIFDTYKLPSCMFTAPAGKFFSGWTVGGYPKDPDDTINVLGNTTVYANWRDIPAGGFSVTFDANGGTGNMAKKTNCYGEFILPECTFTPPAGKRFCGWSVWPGNYGTAPAGRKIIVWKDTTLTALWEDIPQGSNVIKTASYDIAAPVAGATSKAGTVLTTNKYTVSLGWSTTKDGSNLNDFNNKAFEAGKTYYADLNFVAKDPYTFKEGATVYVNGKAYTAVWTIGADYKKYVSVYDVPFSVPSQTPSHTHTPSAWRTTGAYHYKACTECGEFLEQEDHKGGSATCSQKGKCTVCGYAYIGENEKHNPDTAKWTACGSLYHAHLCKDCGAHCDAQDHVAGPAGTPDAAVVCKDCGYIITPAKNHTHKLTKVAKKAATCTDPGNVEYYTCNGCSYLFADSKGKTKITDTVIAPSGHKISDAWKYDNDNHWRTCTVCNTVLAETKLAHEMASGKCSSCGYKSAVAGTNPSAEPSKEPGTEPTKEVGTEPTKEVSTEPSAEPGTESSAAPITQPSMGTEPGTEKTEPTSAPTTDEEEGGKDLLWLWVALVVIAVGGGGFALCWFVLRKKRNA